MNIGRKRTVSVTCHILHGDTKGKISILFYFALLLDMQDLTIFTNNLWYQLLLLFQRSHNYVFCSLTSSNEKIP